MYNESDFTWMKRRPKSRLAVNISNETDFKMNPALVKELPERVDIGCIAEEKLLAIREDCEAPAHPRSGLLKLPELIKLLTAQGMGFPARFTVKRIDDLWVGTLDPQPPKKINADKPPRRRKKPDIESLAKEAAKL